MALLPNESSINGYNKNEEKNYIRSMDKKDLVNACERELLIQNQELREKIVQLQETTLSQEKQIQLLKRTNYEQLDFKDRMEKYCENMEILLSENSEQLYYLIKNITDFNDDTPDIVFHIETLKEDNGFVILNSNASARKCFGNNIIANKVYYDVFELLPGKVDLDIDNFSEVKNGVSFISKSMDGKRYWRTYIYSVPQNINVFHLAFVSREITAEYEREQLSLALNTSINCWPLLYWICNDKNEFVLQNSACKNVWGDRCGQKFDYDLFPESICDEVRLGVENIYAGESFTIQYRLKDTSGKYVLLRLNPMITESGIIKGFSGIVLDISDRRELEQKVLTSVIHTEENERKYFSQELHDSLNPLLSAAGYYIDWLEKPDKKISTKEVIDDLRNIISEALQSSRNIAHKLSPHVLENSGFVEALKVYCERIRKTCDIHIEVVSDMEEIHNRTIETVMYRVVCESINNTIKHAYAHHVSIRISSTKEFILVNFSDDGRGFDMKNMNKSRKGIGLLSIESRIKYINGSISYKSAIGEGFNMEIKVPLEREV